MKKKYDVIIIGAGPAGLECANQLKRSNLSILLIEKNKVIGLKVCGGGLTVLCDGFGIPDNYTRKFDKFDCFLKDKKFEIIYANPIKTISRFNLGKYQLKEIENFKNIKILKNTYVKSIKYNKLITNRGIFYFNYLVGADGSNSIVRRYLGLKTKFYMGLYYNIDKIKDKLVWYLNYDLLKFGYIWEFPHKNYTNIGIFFDPKKIKTVLAKKILENYLKKNNYDFSNKKINGGIGNYCYQGYRFKNIFLTGDAAGLILKDTGEGISSALISGREVGKKIFDPAYSMKYLKKIIKIKRKRELVFSLLFFPPFNKFFLNLFIRLSTKHWFQKIISSNKLNK